MDPLLVSNYIFDFRQNVKKKLEDEAKQRQEKLEDLLKQFEVIKVIAHVFFLISLPRFIDVSGVSIDNLSSFR